MFPLYEIFPFQWSKNWLCIKSRAMLIWFLNIKVEILSKKERIANKFGYSVLKLVRKTWNNFSNQQNALCRLFTSTIGWIWKKIHNQKAVVCKTFSLLIPWLCREKCITCAESIGSNKTNLVPNLILRAK